MKGRSWNVPHCGRTSTSWERLRFLSAWSAFLGWGPERRWGRRAGSGLSFWGCLGSVQQREAGGSREHMGCFGDYPALSLYVYESHTYMSVHVHVRAGM